MLDLSEHLLQKIGCTKNILRQKVKQRKKYFVILFIVLVIKCSVGALIYLTSGDDHPIYKDTVPVLRRAYIPRQLTHRNLMNNDTLFNINHGNSNVVILSKIKHVHANMLVKNGHVQTVEDTIRYQKIGGNYITNLATVSQFHQICKLRESQSLHWINYAADEFLFEWKATCGSMEFVQSAIDKNSKYVSESVLANKLQFKKQSQVLGDHVTQNNTVIIVGGPGAGKTTLLASIGHTYRKMNPDAIVMFSDLGNFLQHFDTYKDDTFEATIKNTIVEFSCDNNMRKQILQSGISRSAVKIVLLLNGFDQLQEHEIVHGLDVLQNITRMSSVFLFVTTTPFYLSKLETQLNSMAYEIEPYSYDSQVEFLVQYWSHWNSSLNAERLKIFAKTCIKKLHTEMSAMEKSFTGIALLSVLIGETYEQNATEYATNENAITSEPPILAANSVNQLFEFTTLRKLANFKDKFESLMYCHSQKAIKVRYPNVSVPDQCSFPENELTQIGLIETYKSKDYIQFIHPTFIDYFIAWHLLHCPEKHLCQLISRDTFEMFQTETRIELHFMGEFVTHYDFKNTFTLYFLIHRS